MRVSPSDNELHDRIVQAQVQAYRNEGSMVIAADIQGWPRPQRVGRHVPDIMVERQGRVVFNEVETCETIQSSETKEQMVGLSSEGPLHVTVPRRCLDKAKSTLSQWGVRVEMWWHYDGG